MDECTMPIQRVLLCIGTLISTLVCQPSIAQDTDFQYSLAEIVALADGVVVSRVVQVMARGDSTCEVMKNSVALGFRNKAIAGRNELRVNECELRVNECVKELPASISPVLSGKRLKDAFYVLVTEDSLDSGLKGRLKFLSVIYGVHIDPDSVCPTLLPGIRKQYPNAVCQPPSALLSVE